MNNYGNYLNPTKTFMLSNKLNFSVPSKKMVLAARFSIREIFLKNRYRQAGFEIKSSDNIIDIGANMGLFVLWVAPQASRGTIIAVEPSESINVLRMNIERNSIKNVKIVNAAIGVDGHYIDMITFPGFNVINHQTDMKPTLLTRFLVYLFTSQKRYGKVMQKVPSISLGKIMDDYGLKKVNLLKIDAEGCEYEIFRNISDEHLDRIEKIVMEFHEYHPLNRHRKLIKFLKLRGYNIHIKKPLLDYYLVGKCGFIWAWKK